MTTFRNPRFFVAVVGLVMLTSAGTVACAQGQSVDTASATAASMGVISTPASGVPRTMPTQTDPIVVVRKVPREQWKRIVRTGTWRPGCPVGRKELRRLEVSYFDFDGRTQQGVLVAHQDSAKDLAEIFTWMYQTKFPIARMQPAEEFGGDLPAILAANNTSAFNCRQPGQINAPVTLSPHANGRSIDINPVQNPWKDPRCECWMPSKEFKGPLAEGTGVIRRGSPVIQQFIDRGWVWQNIKVADYMHFDTGYPSGPRNSLR